MHDIRFRCFFNAFWDWNQSLPGADAGDGDFRIQVRKKLWRCLHCMSGDHKLTRVIACWLAAPLDHLWQFMQHLDNQRHVIRSLVHSDTSPFVHAARTYSQIIFDNLDEGGLCNLFIYLAKQVELDDALDGITMDDIYSTTRQLTSSLNCQVIWRGVDFFKRYPIQGIPTG